MKRFSLLLLALVAGTFAFAQQPIDDGTHRNFKVVTERSAEYPGGDQALYKRMFEEMQYPEEAKEKRIEGNVMVSFYVEPDSTTSEVKAMSKLGHGTSEEAERLIKGLKFAPAIQGGRAIRQQMMIPVIFRIYD